MTQLIIDAIDAGGDPVPRAQVIVRLVAGPRPTDPGYLPGSGQVVGVAQHQANARGHLDLDLTPTDEGSDLVPADCYYDIAVNGQRFAVTIPSSGGPFHLGDPAIAAITPVPPGYVPGVVDEAAVIAIVQAVLAATNVGGALSGDLLDPGFAVDMATQGELDAEVTARVAAEGALDERVTVVEGPRIQAILAPGTLAHLEVVDGRNTVDSFVVPAQTGLEAVPHCGIDAGDPALCPGRRIAVLSQTGAPPPALFWSVAEPMAAVIPDLISTIAGAAFGGVALFAGDPRTYTLTLGDDVFVVVLDEDFDGDNYIDLITELVGPMMTAGLVTIDENGVITTVGTGADSEFTIAVSGGADPLGIDGFEARGADGFVRAIPGDVGALGYDSWGGYENYLPPVAATHTFENDRTMQTRVAEIESMLDGDGEWAWMAVQWSNRLSDFGWREGIKAQDAIDGLRYREGLANGVYTATSWVAINGVLTPVFEPA